MAPGPAAGHAEIEALRTQLTAELATRSEVRGAVLDLALEARVQDANDQADLASVARIQTPPTPVTLRHLLGRVPPRGELIEAFLASELRPEM